MHREDHVSEVQEHQRHQRQRQQRQRCRDELAEHVLKPADGGREVQGEGAIAAVGAQQLGRDHHREHEDHDRDHVLVVRERQRITEVVDDAGEEGAQTEHDEGRCERDQHQRDRDQLGLPAPPRPHRPQRAPAGQRPHRPSPAAALAAVAVEAHIDDPGVAHCIAPIKASSSVGPAAVSSRSPTPDSAAASRIASSVSARFCPRTVR